MPRGSKIQNNSSRVNWTNQPHYQMHGGSKNRSGYGFRRGWENSVFDKLLSVKIRSYTSKKSNNEFPGTTIQDVLLSDDKNDLGKRRFGKWGLGRWGDGLLDRHWLRSRTDKFLLRGMNVGSEEDCANIVRALKSIAEPDYARNAPPELRKQYREARKFFLEEGGLKVSVRRTITGGHWNPLKWRKGLRGTKIANSWRREREEIVASLARDRIREATVAAYAKTRSVEFAKHVKEQMLAALLEKKDGVRALDKLFQCAKDAQWVDGSWKKRDFQEFSDKFRSEKRDAALEFFKIHDAVVFGDPSKLRNVVQEGAKNAMDIIDKVADPSYYQMHGDSQGQSQYRLKAGWARSDLGRAQFAEDYNTFLKKDEPDNFLKGNSSNRGFFEDRWPSLSADTDKYLEQEMEVGTPAERQKIKENLNGILSLGLHRKSGKISKQQKNQNAAAHEFFFLQRGLRVRIGRTRTGSHWNPFKWRRGLKSKSHFNLYRTAREDMVAKAALQRIEEATIAAYAKTDSLEFAKHVKQQMLAALLEKKMDGRPLDKLFQCAERAHWEKPKSRFSREESSDLRRANKYDTEKREAAPEFFNIYDAVTYGKPLELRKVAQSGADLIKQGDIVLVNQDDNKYDIKDDNKYDIKDDSSKSDVNLSNFPSNFPSKLSRKSTDPFDDLESNELKKNEVDTKDIDISEENIGVKNKSGKKPSISGDSRDKYSENRIVEEERKPKQEKQEPSFNEAIYDLYGESVYKENAGLAMPGDISPDGNGSTPNPYSDKDSNNASGPDNMRQSKKIADAKSDIEDGKKKKIEITIGDTDDSLSDTGSVYSDKGSNNASGGPDNRRQSKKVADAASEIGNNDDNQFETIDPNTDLKIENDNENQIVTTDAGIYSDSDSDSKIADDNQEPIVTLDNDGESRSGADDSDMDTDSSKESIPNMANLHNRKGEAPQVLEDFAQNNNNNNDDENIPNAEEWEKGKDGVY